MLPHPARIPSLVQPEYRFVNSCVTEQFGELKMNELECGNMIENRCHYRLTFPKGKFEKFIVINLIERQELYHSMHFPINSKFQRQQTETTSSPLLRPSFIPFAFNEFSVPLLGHVGRRRAFWNRLKLRNSTSEKGQSGFYQCLNATSSSHRHIGSRDFWTEILIKHNTRFIPLCEWRTERLHTYTYISISTSTAKDDENSKCHSKPKCQLRDESNNDYYYYYYRSCCCLVASYAFMAFIGVVSAQTFGMRSVLCRTSFYCSVLFSCRIPKNRSY